MDVEALAPAGDGRCGSATSATTRPPATRSASPECRSGAATPTSTPRRTSWVPRRTPRRRVAARRPGHRAALRRQQGRLRRRRLRRPDDCRRPAQPADRGRPRAGDRNGRGVLPRRSAHHRARLLRGGRLLVPGSHRGRPFELPQQQQGEGIAVAADGTVYASSEGLHAPVLRIAMPKPCVPSRRLRRAPPRRGRSPRRPRRPCRAPRKAPSSPGTTRGQRSAWGWALGGLVGLAIVVVLVRSLRPR